MVINRCLVMFMQRIEKCVKKYIMILKFFPKLLLPSRASYHIYMHMLCIYMHSTKTFVTTKTFKCVWLSIYIYCIGIHETSRELRAHAFSWWKRVRKTRFSERVIIKKHQYFSVILYNTNEYPVFNIYVENSLYSKESL